MVAGLALGAFDLVRPLAVGGMGVVWEGAHRGLGVPVAVKAITTRRAQEPRYLAAFAAEARAVAGLSHPAVVEVFEYGRVGGSVQGLSEQRSPSHALAEGSPYLVMELARGGTLEDAWHPPTGSWVELRSLLLQLLAGLAHAHAHGVLHGDLKPRNVLVFGEEGPALAVKLADFGLAGQAPGGGVLAGTPTHMAPEQFGPSAGPHGPPTDLYQLGCVAWELCSGAPPHVVSHVAAADRAALFEAYGAAHRSRPSEALPSHLALPEGFEGWVRCLLAPRPSERFQFAAHAMHALQRLGPPVVSPVAGRPGLVPPSSAPGGGTTLFAPAPPVAVARRSPSPAPTPRPASPVLLPPVPLDWRERGGAAVASGRWLSGAGLGLYGLRRPPLVGREREQEALWHALAATAADGRARCVVLRGGAGAGKTRLAEWLLGRARELGVADGLRLRAGGAELADLVASAEQRFGALEARLAPTGQDRARVVCIDDAHAAPGALELFDRLLQRRRVAPLPVLVVLTVRDESGVAVDGVARWLGAIEGREGTTSLALGPLPDAAHRELVRSLLGMEGHLARDVEARTAGNPMFAVELVGDWVRRGVLRPGHRGFELASDDPIPLPAGIHEVWSGRLEALLRELPGGATSALDRAAALGEDVDDAEWEAACADLSDGLPDAVREALLSEGLARGGAPWSFAHPMLRESVRHRAEEAGRWVEANERCVQALADRDVAQERLARLLVSAGRSLEAIDPLLEATAERLRQGEYLQGEALAALARAQLEAADPADDRWGRLQLLDLRFALANGRFEEGERAAAALLEDATRRGWTALEVPARRWWAFAALKQARLEEGSDRMRAAAAAAAAAGLAEDAARCTLDLAFAAKVQGDEATSLDAAAQALTRFEDLGLERKQAECHLLFGQLHTVAHRLEQAEQALVRALELLGGTSRRLARAATLNSLGELHRARGEQAAAVQRYRQSADTFAEIGAAEEAYPLINLGLLAPPGSSAAVAGLERAVLLAEAAGNTGVADHACAILLPLAGETERDALWARCLSRVRASYGPGPVVDPDLVQALVRAARSATARGRRDEATVLRALAGQGPPPKG